MEISRHCSRLTAFDIVRHLRIAVASCLDYFTSCYTAVQARSLVFFFFFLAWSTSFGFSCFKNGKKLEGTEHFRGNFRCNGKTPMVSSNRVEPIAR